MKRARVLIPVSLAVLAVTILVASSGSSEPRQGTPAAQWTPPDWKSPTAPPPNPVIEATENAP